MKDAIEKAIKNGFDLVPFVGRCHKNHTAINIRYRQSIMPCDLEIKYKNTEESSCCYAYIDYYRLIFGTDFIESLVCNGFLCTAQPIIATESSKSCGLCDYERYGLTRCPSYEASNIKTSEYHRQQMASLKDIARIMSYVNKLCSEH